MKVCDLTKDNYNISKDLYGDNEYYYLDCPYCRDSTEVYDSEDLSESNECTWCEKEFLIKGFELFYAIDGTRQEEQFAFPWDRINNKIKKDILILTNLKGDLNYVL